MGELELTETPSSNWVGESGLNGQRVRGGQTRGKMGSPGPDRQLERGHSAGSV